MAYKLKTGEDAADAAREMLGDARLTSDVMVIGDTAYLKDEQFGPPAEWAVDPAKLRLR